MIMRRGYQKVSDVLKRNFLEIFLGALVLFSALLFLLFSLKFTTFRDSTNSDFTIVAEFTSADGLKIGTDVKIAGVKVGLVSDIYLNSEDFLAVVTLKLSKNLSIPDDSEAVIITEGLIGQKYISLNIGGSPSSLSEGETLLYSQGSIDIINLFQKFSSGND